MTDEILNKALDLQKLIKESDEFLSALETMDPTDELTTITVCSPRRSASMHVCRFPAAVLALRDAMREEWEELNSKYSKL